VANDNPCLERTVDRGRMTGKPEVIPADPILALTSDCRTSCPNDGPTGSNAGPVVGGLRFLGFAANRSSMTSLRLLVSRKLDSQSFASVDEGCQARNGLLKPFGSLPNALSFSNSLRKLRLALRRMPAHSL
jgi:hypothetical protein